MGDARSGPTRLNRSLFRHGVWLLGLVAGLGQAARSQNPVEIPPSAAGPATLIPAPLPIQSPDLARPQFPERPTPTGFFGVAAASIFGPATERTWRPLRLRTLFSEGWDEPWAAEPNDSGDAQQGWINAADGNFYRLHFFSYVYTNSLARGGDANTGAYTLYTPLSRRLELITNIPFVTSQPTLGIGKQLFSNPTAPSRPTGRPIATGFGDITFTPRVMLLDTVNVGVNAQMSIQTPTGDRRTGAGQTVVTPGVQFWWNFTKGWIVRGGFNAGVGTNRQANGTTLVSQLALGRVFTPHDVPIFGDFTIYLSTNVFNTVSDSRTTATLTPGFRTHLGQNWYALGGTEIPVTGRRPFAQSAIFWIMKTF